MFQAIHWTWKWEKLHLFPPNSSLQSISSHAQFLYLLKTLENQRFAGLSRGYRNGTMTWNGIVLTEAATGGVLLKKAILKNLQYSQETPVLELLFDKVAGLRPETLLKRNSNTVAFLWILLNFYKHPFWKTFANGCFYFNAA